MIKIVSLIIPADANNVAGDLKILLVILRMLLQIFMIPWPIYMILQLILEKS